MTTLVGTVRAPVSISRRYLAAGTFIVLGLIDIFVFGFFAHSGDARFALSLPRPLSFRILFLSPRAPRTASR